MINNNIGSSLASLHTTESASEKAKSLIRGARGVQKEGEIDKLAQDFEAVFITEMLRPIFESIQTNDTFGGGRGEEVFRSMMLDEYGKNLSQAGGIGLADHVKASLIEMQGVSFEQAEQLQSKPNNSKG